MNYIDRKAPLAHASGAFLSSKLAHLLLHRPQRPVHSARIHLAALSRGLGCLARPGRSSARGADNLVRVAAAVR
jgi:hypothetical protein